MRALRLTILLTITLTLLPGRLATGTVIPPSGKVAYISQGRLWILDLASGRSRELQRTWQIHRPIWSASGRHLTFWSEGKLWVSASDGSKRHVLSGATTPAAWSPTDELVAYWSVDGHLRIETADGEEQARFKGQELKHFFPPLWSPDGRWLAYVESMGDPPTAKAQLFRAPSGGGNPEALFALGSETFPCLYLAAWPRPDRILSWYQRQCSASLAADGIALGEVLIKEGRLEPLLDSTLKVPVATAATGEVAVTAGSSRYSWIDKQIVRIPARGGGFKPASPPEQVAIHPAWSPDGQSLAWSAMEPAPDDNRGREALRNRRLWRMVVPTGIPVPVTSDPAYRDEAPVFTGDGEHLLFVRLDAKERATLWLLPLRTGRPQKLAELDRPKGGDDYYGWVEWGWVFAYSPW